MSRPTRSCTGCGIRTTAIHRVCMTCRRTTHQPDVPAAPISTDKPIDRLALDGGTWHYVKGVWRWIHWEAA